MESPAIKYFVVKKWKGIYLAYRRKDIEVTGYWTTDN